MRVRSPVSSLRAAPRSPRLRHRRVTRLLCARASLAVAVLALACGGPPARPPTAVVDAAPPSVCSGDGFATVIRLTSARSSSRLSLAPEPPGPDDPPLELEWTLAGGEHAVVEGDLRSRDLGVVTAGDRPLHVTLRVVNELGGVAITTRTIGIAVADAPPCEGERECPAGTECAAYRDGQACLPTGSCAGDGDCPSCFVCEASRCVPPEAP